MQFSRSLLWRAQRTWRPVTARFSESKTKVLLTLVSVQRSKWSADSAWRLHSFCVFFFLTFSRTQSRVSPRPFSLTPPHSQGSNCSILFLWATSASDTKQLHSTVSSSLEQRSDCTDRPWHPQRKSRWAKDLKLGTHITCFRSTERLLGFCETVVLPAAEQTATEWATLQEMGGLAELYVEDKIRLLAWILEDPSQLAFRWTSEESPGGSPSPLRGTPNIGSFLTRCTEKGSSGCRHDVKYYTRHLTDITRHCPSVWSVRFMSNHFLLSSSLPFFVDTVQCVYLRLRVFSVCTPSLEKCISVQVWRTIKSTSTLTDSEFTVPRCSRRFQSYTLPVKFCKYLLAVR